MNDAEDLKLVALFQTAPRDRGSADQTAAAREFHRTYDPMIRVIAKKYCRMAQDVEDVVQEVWVELLEELPKLRYDPLVAPLRNWIAAVARHAAIKAARSLERWGHCRGESAAVPVTSEIAEYLVDQGASPVLLCERKLEREIVRAELAAVGAKSPELTQRILTERVLEGRTVPQIATQLRMPEHSAEMRLCRALTKVRVGLRLHGIGPV